jgi:glycosyltransferase involved in cell wall biosynthesis
MAATLPVVTTRVGAIPEAIQDGKNGLIVEAGSVEDLHQAINTLVAQPQLRLEMGLLGRKRAEAEYDAQQNARRLLELIKVTASPHLSPSGGQHMGAARRPNGRSE